MTRFSQSSGGPRTKALRAAFHEARIAQAQSDIFDRAEAFIDRLLLARNDPAQLAEMTELIASSQYGGSTGNVAEKSRQAVAGLLAEPENRNCRRVLLAYLIYEVQSPAFVITTKSQEDGVQAEQDMSQDRLIPPLEF